MNGIKDSIDTRDRIRGSLIGGAAGDALGYEIEFDKERYIFEKYGKDGIQEYALNPKTGKATISDDTQMTLFTANGLLYAETMNTLQGTETAPRIYVAEAYQDWLRTQNGRYHVGIKRIKEGTEKSVSWLSWVPELYQPQAPGNSCLSALEGQKYRGTIPDDFIIYPQNNSHGCGGIMRVAPVGLKKYDMPIEQIDMEGAQIAAITHGNSLGYMPAAVLVHIINRIVYPEKEMTLKEIVLDARDTMKKVFEGDTHLEKLIEIIDNAVDFSENDENDLDNIHRLGEGWVGEEALGISLYCALRHQDDFSAALIASVNHKGDSDSTGAITGNILGAWFGLEAIEDKWKENLELYDVILTLADDLYTGCPASIAESEDNAPDWAQKYIHMRPV